MRPEGQILADPDTLTSRVAAQRALLGDRAGPDLLRSLITGSLAGRIALVSSFGAESAVLLHMVSRIDPATPVIFLDTGKLFAETLAYRDALTARLGLTDVRGVGPGRADLERHDPDGTLWSLEPDLCCHIRKTEPLDQALDGFDAWITGRKRFHGAGRAALPTLEGDPATGRIKVNPLAPWSAEQLSRYLADHDLPVHPLVRDGYRSIGCVPCTRPVAPGENPRAGRWSWLDKTECGIHGDGI
jgi:phosphoadenosine phosphosulfate reductase